MRTQGRLDDWNDQRGFGYIKPLDGGPATFVHISALPIDRRRPLVTDLLTYELGTDDRGRSRAVKVQYLSAARTRPRPSSPARRSVANAPFKYVAITTAGFIALTGLLAALGTIPWYLPVAYVVMSVLTFLAYGADKAAAQSGEWRTGEGTLIGMGLLGGWPGALVAQEYFHHKTRKQPFRTVFLLSVAVNIAVLMWIAASAGG